MMAKKTVKTESKTESRNVDLLIENSIALQKILANLAASLDGLSRDVRRMVDIFSEANRAFAGGKRPSGTADVKILQSRMDDLIEQNKVMANSIVLLESSLREKLASREEAEETKLKKLPQFRF